MENAIAVPVRAVPMFVRLSCCSRDVAICCKKETTSYRSHCFAEEAFTFHYRGKGIDIGIAKDTWFERRKIAVIR